MELSKLISNLPETVPSIVLKKYFIDVIRDLKNDSIIEKERVSELLQILSYKQWHNYNIFEIDLRFKIDIFVIYLLAGDISNNLVENVGETIGYLGLTKSYERLKEISNERNTEFEIRSTINEIFKEFGDRVDNPYSGFWGNHFE